MRRSHALSLLFVTLSLAACCTRQYSPAFEGLYTEGPLGSRTLAPGPVMRLAPTVRSALLNWPHSREGTAMPITVPASATHVTVDAVMDTSWVITLSGVGYTQIWLGLDMNVSTLNGAIQCRAPHLEQDNVTAGAGGFSDHRPGPRVTLRCDFFRAASDPTDYRVNVFASVNGTFLGAAGGDGDYYVQPGPVSVTACP